MMDNSVFSVLLTGVQFAFLIRLFSLLVSSPAVMLLHQLTAADNHLVEDLQHLAAQVEGSQPPQEVDSAHPFPVCSIPITQPPVFHLFPVTR